MTITPRSMTANMSRRLLALGAAAAVVFSASACSTSSPKKADAKSEVGSTVS